MKTENYPSAIDPSRVGEYPAVVKAGGGYVSRTVIDAYTRWKWARAEDWLPDICATLQIHDIYLGEAPAPSTVAL